MEQASRIAVPAPPGLIAVMDYLNTLDERSYRLRGIHRTGGDRLASTFALAGWLAEHGLIPAGTAVSTGDLAAAREVRAALRQALITRLDPGDGAAGDAGPADAGPGDVLAGANQALAGLTLRLEVGDGGTPRLAPVAAGVPAVLASLAASTAVAAADGTWQRLKICAAPDCRWVFYDSSRSGAGRWCSMRICGNRGKTRAYRERHRGQAG